MCVRKWFRLHQPLCSHVGREDRHHLDVRSAKRRERAERVVEIKIMIHVCIATSNQTRMLAGTSERPALSRSVDPWGSDSAVGFAPRPRAKPKDKDVLICVRLP